LIRDFISQHLFLIDQLFRAVRFLYPRATSTPAASTPYSANHSP